MVTGFLVYCFIGSLFWVMMDFLGITHLTFSRRLKSGRPPSALQMACAILAAILAWPWVMRDIYRHPRRTARALARNLWGRP